MEATTCNLHLEMWLYIYINLWDQLPSKTTSRVFHKLHPYWHVWNQRWLLWLSLTSIALNTLQMFHSYKRFEVTFMFFHFYWQEGVAKRTSSRKCLKSPKSQSKTPIFRVQISKNLIFLVNSNHDWKFKIRTGVLQKVTQLFWYVFFATFKGTCIFT